MRRAISTRVFLDGTLKLRQCMQCMLPFVYRCLLVLYQVMKKFGIWTLKCKEFFCTSSTATLGLIALLALVPEISQTTRWFRKWNYNNYCYWVAFENDCITWNTSQEWGFIPILWEWFKEDGRKYYFFLLSLHSYVT